MNRRRALKALAGLALCPLCSQNGIAAEGAHWSYEGDHGPANWADLDAANKFCAIGSQQSPIDIGATVKAQLPPDPKSVAAPVTARLPANRAYTSPVGTPKPGLASTSHHPRPPAGAGPRSSGVTRSPLKLVIPTG